MNRLLGIGVLAMLSASAARAQVDTLRVDTASGRPTVTLQDASRAPGSASAHVTDSGATIVLGPRPDSTVAPRPAPPRPRVRGSVVLAYALIVGAMLSMLFASLAAWRRGNAQRRRLRR